MLSNIKTRRNTENESVEPDFQEFPYLKQQMQKRNKYRFWILIKQNEDMYFKMLGINSFKVKPSSSVSEC